ncbi:hypothetical protein BS420_04565 [Cronobacter sakazakii]|nr:hypothetical protein BS420_04565 [Cronobacter sakazakii]
MKRVLVFFNDEPATVLTVINGVTNIRRKYPSGKDVSLEILSTTFTSPTGSRVIYVATDRELTYEEIRVASRKLNRP